MSAVLDTHAAIWYLIDSAKISETVYRLIDNAAADGTPTYISAVTLIETVCLSERGRITADALSTFMTALGKENPAFRVVPVDTRIAQALSQVPRITVPDMPDRIIAATAAYLVGLPLVTRDPAPSIRGNSDDLVTAKNSAFS